MLIKTTRQTYSAPCRRDVNIAVAIVLLLVPTAAHAQQRTFYDASGKVSGRAVTDSSGASVFYNASGNVTGRSATDSQGTTRFFDAGGRNFGSVTTSK
jgi:hypothetical protein